MNIGKHDLPEWLRLVACVLFHKKEIKTFTGRMQCRRVVLCGRLGAWTTKVPDLTFTIETAQYKGCQQCDVWRKL